ncbi:hypothetical protein [Lacihabitans sp. LS3-19]|uniref:hypothetical protein n=1 Tax=Lacihabitans sp. LS3-19 TaxID=2487335 RepID=UPI0020CC26F1|nr:hypothetical protein [Lacihabitans sp. LS3-19]
MKTIIGFFTLLVFACNTGNSNSKTQDSTSNELFFNYSIDGKDFYFTEEDILTSYNDFGKGDHEFKVYVGKDNGPQLSLTIINDMSAPSSTPSGDPNPGHKLFQGSVSLQDYPDKIFTFNSYDGLLNPKPTPVSDAIVITKSKLEPGGKARIISGKLNVTVLGGENKSNDPAIKDYVLKGDFRIRHKFSGSTF